MYLRQQSSKTAVSQGENDKKWYSVVPGTIIPNVALQLGGSCGKKNISQHQP